MTRFDTVGKDAVEPTAPRKNEQPTALGYSY
jgi:hypothetical protein